MREPSNLFQPLPSKYFFQVSKCALGSTINFSTVTPESYRHLYAMHLKNQFVQSVKTRVRLCHLLSYIQNHFCRKLIFAPKTNSNRLIPHINFVSDRYSYHVRIVAIL